MENKETMRNELIKLIGLNNKLRDTNLTIDVVDKYYKELIGRDLSPGLFDLAILASYGMHIAIAKQFLFQFFHEMLHTDKKHSEEIIKIINDNKKLFIEVSTTYLVENSKSYEDVKNNVLDSIIIIEEINSFID